MTKKTMTYSEEEINVWQKMVDLYVLRQHDFQSVLNITEIAHGGKSKNPIVYDVVTDEIQRTVFAGKLFTRFMNSAGKPEEFRDSLQDKFEGFKPKEVSKALFEINSHFVNTVQNEYVKSLKLLEDCGIKDIHKETKMMSQSVSSLILNSAEVVERLKFEVVNKLNEAAVERITNKHNENKSKGFTGP